MCVHEPLEAIEKESSPTARFQLIQHLCFVGDFLLTWVLPFKTRPAMFLQLGLCGTHILLCFNQNYSTHSSVLLHFWHYLQQSSHKNMLLGFFCFCLFVQNAKQIIPAFDTWQDTMSTSLDYSKTRGGGICLICGVGVVIGTEHYDSARL